MPYLVPLEVKESPVGGCGLFAMADIPKGTKTWVMRPKGDDVAKVVPLTLRVEDPRAVNEPNVVWTEEKMRALPKEKLEATLWGGYAHEPTQQWIELRDGASFTNHSDKPNCEADWSDDPWEEQMHTIRDIKAGEEIFEDYGIFASTKLPWILQLMKEACPGRVDFEDSHVASREYDNK